MFRSLDLLITSAICTALLLRWGAESLGLSAGTTLQMVSIAALAMAVLFGAGVLARVRR